MSLLYVAIGLALLAGGGELLVRGAVALAERMAISPVLVGLTVVAVGTSMPELTVAVQAAMRGSPDIAMGSIVGSNISNILLVLAVTAIIQPIRTLPRLLFRDGLFLLAVSFGLGMVALTGVITLGQGIAMVALLCLYIGFSYWAEVVRRVPSAERREGEVDEYRGIPPRFFVALPALIAGIAAVVWGADLLVTGAVDIARFLGVNEAVIGLSLVAIGTSLPELAISALAAYRGHSEVAVGNIVGSNISNILLILGITASLGGVAVAPEIARFDVWVMVAATAAMIPLLMTGQQLRRREGTIFLLLFAAYIASIYAGLPHYVIEAVRG